MCILGKGGDVQVFLTNTWTLEYEIAKSCLRNLIHKSILLAQMTNNLENQPTPEMIILVKEKLIEDSEKWAKEAKNEIQIAVEIYSPLERKQVSKAVVAQLFTQYLIQSKIDKAVILSDPHLKYLIDAIKYVANV